MTQIKIKISQFESTVNCTVAFDKLNAEIKMLEKFRKTLNIPR